MFCMHLPSSSAVFGCLKVGLWNNAGEHVALRIKQEYVKAILRQVKRCRVLYLPVCNIGGTFHETACSSIHLHARCCMLAPVFSCSCTFHESHGSLRGGLMSVLHASCSPWDVYVGRHTKLYFFLIMRLIIIRRAIPPSSALPRVSLAPPSALGQYPDSSLPLPPGPPSPSNLSCERARLSSMDNDDCVSLDQRTHSFYAWGVRTGR